MANQIDAKSLTIEQYFNLVEGNFSGYTFFIPEYQRPYTWTISQCDKLWQDIVDRQNNTNMEEDSDNYFFGSVISCNKQDQEKNLELIDGQQRTTTFILLMKALLLKINKVLEDATENTMNGQIFRSLRNSRIILTTSLYKIESDMVADQPDYSADLSLYSNNLKALYLNKSNNEKYQEDVYNILKVAYFEEIKPIKIEGKRKENKYTNFYKNFKYFYFKVDLLEKDDLARFTKTFLKRCSIIKIESNSLDQAINLFNSLNGDGQPLSDVDLLYATMYKSAAEKDTIAKEKNIALFTEKWFDLKAEVDILDKNGVCQIESLFMQYMYYIRAKNAVSLEKTVDSTTPGLRKFFKNRDLEGWEYTKNPNFFCDELIRLAKKWNKISQLNITRVLLRLNQNFK